MTWKKTDVEMPKESPVWVIFDEPNQPWGYLRRPGIGWFFPGNTNFWYVPTARTGFIVIAWQEIEPYELRQES